METIKMPNTFQLDVICVKGKVIDVNVTDSLFHLKTGCTQTEPLVYIQWYFLWILSKINELNTKFLFQKEIWFDSKNWVNESKVNLWSEMNRCTKYLHIKGA